MDIRKFLVSKNSGDTKKLKEEDLSKKIKLKKNYVNLLGSLLAIDVIDMLEYTHMINFLKSGGTLVNMGRYIQIMEKISKNNSRIKDQFKNICEILYSHLYELFSMNINSKIRVEELCIDKIVNNISEHNEGNIEFTKDQTLGIMNICYFLYNQEMKTYGLYGYAGTGKTTIITKLIHYFVVKNYLNSVVFVAPTNKAVNIMKSKFKSDIVELIKLKVGTYTLDNITLNSQLEKLEEKGLKIHFMTIHKLLNYKNDFNVEGDRIFIKGNKSLISNYDLVIIDECSMISMQMTTHIFEEIRGYIRLSGKDDIVKKVPKVLFVGDPAQLPPVNEKVSIIFAKEKSEFNYSTFKQLFKNDYALYFDKENNKENNIKKRFNMLICDILNQKSTTLTHIMRSNDNKIIGLCNNVRSWVIGIVQAPKIGIFKGTKVKLYKYEKGSKKTNSEWFKICLNYILQYFGQVDNKENNHNNNSSNVSNIMLTWTNRQSEEYNKIAREKIFRKTNLSRFEIGDILILNDFYNIKETELKGENDENKRFYTSEQIKIIDKDVVIKVLPPFTEMLSERATKIKNFNDIENRFKKGIRLINKNTDRKYRVWKLFVHKLVDTLVKASRPDLYQIYVIKDESKEKLDREKLVVSEKIKDLRKQYQIFHKENIEKIDKYIIKPLWRELDVRFNEPFANVNYGNCITTHSSQGSSFYNVFVDAHDILQNKNPNEGKRCIYTALTRTSNEVHILI
jgi:hypothetical protein